MKEGLRRSVGVFYGVTLVAATGGAVAVWALGGIEAGGASLGLALTLTMWAPALGRFVTLRTVDVGLDLAVAHARAGAGISARCSSRSSSRCSSTEART